MLGRSRLAVSSMAFAARALTTGTTVPKFAVPAATGEVVSSESLLGKTYLLWFYPKADTPG